MQNGTVLSVKSLNTTFPSFEAEIADGKGGVQTVKSRSVIIGTGLRDVVPDTPGLQENWGQGIYWVRLDS